MEWLVKRLPSLVMAAGVVLVAQTATAQEWPKAKPITIVQPFAAGSDFIIRQVAADLEKRLGQRVIIENRPGASGATGTGYASRQPADGYTLISATPGPAANLKNVMPDLTYKPLEDFQHITMINAGDMAVVARKDFPANTIQELLAYTRANPGKVSVGSNGIGSYGHLLSLLVSDTAGLQVKQVPYRGGAQIVTDLLSGSLDLSIDYYGSAYANQVNTGAIKVLAVASTKRAAIFPNVPTLRESGIDIVAAPWFGIMAPKNTPRAIIDRLNAEIGAFLETAEAKEKFAGIGVTPWRTTPEEMQALVVREEGLWRDIIKKNNIRSE